MINLSTPQKDVVLDFFKEDIQLVKKYFMMIGFDFDESFKYEVFREFIFSAAGMMKDLDHAIYSAELLSSFNIIQTLDAAYLEFKSKSKHASSVYTKEFLHVQQEYVQTQKHFENLKAELQMLISKEKSLNARLEKSKQKELSEEALEKVKTLRKEHVDTIHYLGQRRTELDDVQVSLQGFENEHKAVFLDFFSTVKEKLDYQYSQSLSFFGFEFNEKLFVDSEKSAMVQKFKHEANIKGDINLCKYVEYYLKNVNPDALADQEKKNNLKAAKAYCQDKCKRELSF